MEKKLNQYDVEVEVTCPVLLHFRISAESLEQVKQIITNNGLFKNLKHYSEPKPILNKARKRSAKIKAAGSNTIQLFVKLGD
jgi:hypothetical protein